MKTFEIIFFALMLSAALVSCEKEDTADLDIDRAAEENLVFQLKSLKKDISKRLDTGDYETAMEQFENGQISPDEFLTEIGIDREALEKRLSDMEENINQLSYSSDLERIHQLITSEFEKEIVASRALSTPCFDAYQDEMIEAAFNFAICGVASAKTGVGPFLACASYYTVRTEFSRRTYFRCLDENY